MKLRRTTMKKAFALAILMSTAALGSVQAREMGTAAKSSGDMDIVVMNGHADIGNFGERITPDKSTAQAARTEIRKDPALRTALMHHDVELKNVMAIDKAADGDTIVYVR